MKREYVVAIPTPMGGMFQMERGLTSEYPNAKIFDKLAAAKYAANAHLGGQVYTVKGYETGARPVWVAA